MHSIEWDCVVCSVHVVGSPRSRTGTKCQAHREWRRTTCTTCGAEHYNANRPKPGRNVYCSDRCKQQRRPRSKPEVPAPFTKLQWRYCAHCSRPICKPGRKYCSRTCWHDKTYPVNTGTCLACKNPIGDTHRRRKYCSACRQQSDRNNAAAQRRNHRQRYGKSYRARARQHGVRYERVDRTKVFDRDGWRCGICKRRVDKRLTAPHPMAASLDHVIPMSLGGDHAYVNVQCAHHLCNSLKSNRGTGDQLALVG